MLLNADAFSLLHLTAIATAFGLATGNRRHFAGLPGLVVLP
jgi:hypothetical protein